MTRGTTGHSYDSQLENLAACKTSFFFQAGEMTPTHTTQICVYRQAWGQIVPGHYMFFVQDQHRWCHDLLYNKSVSLERLTLMRLPGRPVYQP